MSVTIDQAGQDGGAGKIDHGCARGNRRGVPWRYALNAVPGDDDHHVLAHVVRCAGKKMTGPDISDLRRRRGFRRLLRHTTRNQNKKCENLFHPWFAPSAKLMHEYTGRSGHRAIGSFRIVIPSKARNLLSGWAEHTGDSSRPKPALGMTIC